MDDGRFLAHKNAAPFDQPLYIRNGTSVICDISTCQGDMMFELVFLQHSTGTLSFTVTARTLLLY